MDLSKNEKKVLIKVNNTQYIAELAKECSITHANSVVVCKKLYNKELILYRRVKNKKYIMLTENGTDVQELLLKINMRGD